MGGQVVRPYIRPGLLQQHIHHKFRAEANALKICVLLFQIFALARSRTYASHAFFCLLEAFLPEHIHLGAAVVFLSYK